MDHKHTDFAKLDAEMDYEEKSLPTKQIMWNVFALLGILVVTMIIIFLVVGAPKAIPRPDIVTQRKMLMPTLQSDPPTALKIFKAEQQAHLNGYGWVDKAQGIVHIPIQTAMDKALERGLFPSEGKK